MLSKILSKSSCAKCRVCCVFDKYDVWETPVINDALRGKIEKSYPEQKFVSKGEKSSLFIMEPAADGLFYCPMLTETGCALGDEKPFDCRIWPFRIMRVGGLRAITLSPVCESVFSLPMKEIFDFAKELAPKVFAYADENPDIVKDYEEGYPIILTERNSK